MISISEICTWAAATPSSRNFVEGERVLNAKHLIYCGRIAENNTDNLQVLAFCLQTSGLKQRPHEINGVFNKSGKILSMQCSCRAGLSEKCKHTLAVLLFCSRTNVEELEETSCTDKKCIWSSCQKKSLSDLYDPLPLKDHPCFAANNKSVEVSSEMAEIIKEKMIACNPLSALAKHTFGRHLPITPCTNNGLSESQKCEIAIIISNSESTLMTDLAQIPYKPLRNCCETILNRLDGEALEICERTMTSFADWKVERQYRITGSRCYDLYTYLSNKSPNWQVMSTKYFYPKSFSNKFTKHGLESEPLARTAYESETSTKVIRSGLVISQNNPFLGYSPDGIILENGKPVKLIEIKCPYSGKIMSIEAGINDMKFLEMKNGKIALKKKHKYYGQIQLGMAILNIRKTDFVVYAPFDNSLLVLSVDFDGSFVSKLLPSLKLLYFNEMLHQICSKESP